MATFAVQRFVYQIAGTVMFNICVKIDRKVFRKEVTVYYRQLGQMFGPHRKECHPTYANVPNINLSTIVIVIGTCSEPVRVYVLFMLYKFRA